MIYFNDGKESQPMPNTFVKTPYKNSQEKVFAFYYINDFSDAREIEEKYFEKLADSEFENFINSFNEEYNLWMDIDSDIYNWINTKVLLASNSEYLELGLCLKTKDQEKISLPGRLPWHPPADRRRRPPPPCARPTARYPK